MFETSFQTSKLTVSIFSGAAGMRAALEYRSLGKSAEASGLDSTVLECTRSSHRTNTVSNLTSTNLYNSNAARIPAAPLKIETVSLEV